MFQVTHTHWSAQSGTCLGTQSTLSKLMHRIQLKAGETTSRQRTVYVEVKVFLAGPFIVLLDSLSQVRVWLSTLQPVPSSLSFPSRYFSYFAHHIPHIYFTKTSQKSYTIKSAQIRSVNSRWQSKFQVQGAIDRLTGRNGNLLEKATVWLPWSPMH